MGRFYEFPTALHLTDFILAVMSFILVAWYKSNILDNIEITPTGKAEEDTMVVISIFMNGVNERFDYLFVVITLCLLFRITIIL